MLDRFLDELVITNQDAIPEVKNRQKPKLNKFKSTGKSVPVVTELFSRILIYLRAAIRLRTSIVEPIHLTGSGSVRPAPALEKTKFLHNFKLNKTNKIRKKDNFTFIQCTKFFFQFV